MFEESTDRSLPAADRLLVRKDLLTQLQRLASVGGVASSVAHEFNNILMSILNQAKMGARAADVESKDHSFERIVACARRAARITTGMLALSRNRSLRSEPTDLIQLVDDVLAVLEKDLSKYRVRIERDFQEVPKTSVVPSQIEQLLMNLLINARQAMPRGGVLFVGVAHNSETNMVEIRIRDTGVGIEPTILGKIFDPFFTTKDGPDESGQGGSGLGLSICREIVEQHQGRIRVDSLVGKGTTFTIKLPVAPQSKPAHAA